MPWYEFKCSKCSHTFEKLKVEYKELVLCPDCRGVCVKIPSLTAFRRDHTVLESSRK